MKHPVGELAMLQPSDFEVNEAWIAFRANDSFLYVKDEPYDVYVLMDAASTYLLGQALSRTVDESPDVKEIEALFRTAWSAKRQWAKKLLVPEGSLAEEVFKNQAEKSGLAFITMPLSELRPLVGPVKESFAAYLRQARS